MRTSSRIFGILFLALAVFAAGCALIVAGADHQWYLSAICWVVAFALLIDGYQKIEVTEKRNLNL